MNINRKKKEINMAIISIFDAQRLIYKTLYDFSEFLKTGTRPNTTLTQKAHSALLFLDEMFHRRTFSNELFDDLSDDGYNYLLKRCYDLADIFNLSVRNKLWLTTVDNKLDTISENGFMIIGDIIYCDYCNQRDIDKAYTLFHTYDSVFRRYTYNKVIATNSINKIVIEFYNPRAMKEIISRNIGLTEALRALSRITSGLGVYTTIDSNLMSNSVRAINALNLFGYGVSVISFGINYYIYNIEPNRENFTDAVISFIGIFGTVGTLISLGLSLSNNNQRRR
jgi:hypothetical protein